jgi:hypothetical protein
VRRRCFIRLEIRMTSPWMAAALAVLAPAALAAEPADPAAPVPPPHYRSVFTGPAGVEEETVDWRKANADVAQFPRGHIDLLRWEERQEGQATSAPAPASGPAPAPARLQEKP